MSWLIMQLINYMAGAENITMCHGVLYLSNLNGIMSESYSVVIVSRGINAI